MMSEQGTCHAHGEVNEWPVEAWAGGMAVMRKADAVAQQVGSVPQDT